MSGRTKIAIAVSLLVVSAIAVAVVFNWDSLSGRISAKASPILSGDSDDPNASGTSGGSGDTTDYQWINDQRDSSGMSIMEGGGGSDDSAGGAASGGTYTPNNNSGSTGSTSCKKCDDNIVCSCKCL